MDSVFTYVVVGGGIAGVTCVETIASISPNDKILLLSSSSIVKSVINFRQLTRALEEFEIEEKPSCELSAQYPNITISHQEVLRLNYLAKEVETVDGSKYEYSKLCICTGGKPKIIAKDNPHVLGIRDTETVLTFEKKLTNARRVLIVGNGGIATELVYKIKSCDIIWAIKDESIIGTFVDAGAAKFLLPHIAKEKKEDEGPRKRRKYQIEDDGSASCVHVTSLGCALGPDWTDALTAKGSQRNSNSVHLEYKVEVKALLTYDDITTMKLKPSEMGDNVGSQMHSILLF